jgi:hypothetical protein
MLNVLDFGAVTDGKTDCTAQFQEALDTAGKTRSTVFVPDGTYRVSTLRIPPHSGLIGNPAWSFRDTGGAVLKLIDANAECMIDMTLAQGSVLNGLSRDGAELGECVHGVMVNRPEYGGHGEEDSFRIERCRIDSFSGHGAFLNRIWCYSIRHCMISHNEGDGICVQGWDGFILDCWLTGNKGAGLAARKKSASLTFTANRVEWNYKAGVEICGGDHFILNGNFFDRQGGPGIDIKGRDGDLSYQVNATGNIFFRNGKPERCGNAPYDSSQIRCFDTQGLVLTGNICEVGRDDPNNGPSENLSPEDGIVIGRLDCAVIKDNVLHKGYQKEMLVDLGSHGDQVIIKDNIGTPYSE